MSDPRTGSSESASSTAETPCGELICQRFGWPKEQFLEKAFWRCLPKFAVPFAAILWPWRTRVFARDFEALRDVEPRRRLWRSISRPTVCATIPGSTRASSEIPSEYVSAAVD